MTDKLELRECWREKNRCDKFFTLYADRNSFKDLYIDTKDLFAACPYADFKWFNTKDAVAFYENFHAARKVVRLDEVKDFLSHVPDSRNVFPYQFFDLAAQIIPKPLITIDPPKPIFNTKETDGTPRIIIYRSDKHNLICLQWLSNVLFDTPELSPKLVEQAMSRYVYFDGDNHYVNLHSVKNILCDLGEAALLDRFNHQIFMTPTPDEQVQILLDCQDFTTVPFNEHVFNIYEGEGFAENKFYFRTHDLDDLLDAQGNIVDAADHFGTFYDTENGDDFCRLDLAGKIVRLYCARLWNGSNQHNASIQRGWDFIRWFNNFMPNFLDEQLKYTCNAEPFFDDTQYEEPTEPPIDYSAFPTKKLLVAVAERLGVKYADIANAIIELRQAKLRSELYDE